MMDVFCYCVIVYSKVVWNARRLVSGGHRITSFHAFIYVFTFHTIMRYTYYDCYVVGRVMKRSFDFFFWFLLSFDFVPR